MRSKEFSTTPFGRKTITWDRPLRAVSETSEDFSSSIPVIKAFRTFSANVSMSDIVQCCRPMRPSRANSLAFGWGSDTALSKVVRTDVNRTLSPPPFS